MFSKPVTLRALLIALAVTFLLAAGTGVAASVLILERGPQGATGPPGPEGPEGTAGEVDPDEIQSAVEDAVDSNLVINAIQQDPSGTADALDPSPSDVANDVETLRSDVDSMCSSLQLADALSNDFITCP